MTGTVSLGESGMISTTEWSIGNFSAKRVQIFCGFLKALSSRLLGKDLKSMQARYSERNVKVTQLKSLKMTRLTSVLSWWQALIRDLDFLTKNWLLQNTGQEIFQLRREIRKTLIYSRVPLLVNSY